MSDAEAILSGYAQDVDVTRYLVWRPHPDLQATRAFLSRCADVWAEGSSFPYAILRRSDGKLIGMLELGADGCVGYVLEKASWGQGLMPEALKALIAWCLGPGGYRKIWAHCDVDNPASARVMEKAGMTKEGLLKKNTLHPNVSDEPRDVFSYSITKPS